MRLRGRIWSALFNEGILIFWNSSFAKDCPCNQYLGWEERRYARILQNFSVLLDSGVRRIAPQTAGHLRIWGLESQKEFALYIRDFQDVKEIYSGKQISINSPIYGTGYWYDVHTGDVLEQAELSLGQQMLAIPNFQTDIAFIARNSVPNRPVTDSLFRIDINPRTQVLLNNPLQTPKSFSLLVSNTGNKPITMIKWFVSSPSPKLSLSLSTVFPFTLNPSETKILPVEYTMSDTGGTGAMLSFLQSASPSWENVAISATGVLKSSITENRKDKEELKIYPDPANDLVTIKWLSSNLGKPTVSLLTIEGGEIAIKKLDDNNKAIFDVTKFPSGTYTITLSSEGSILASKKVIIRH